MKTDSERSKEFLWENSELRYKYNNPIKRSSKTKVGGRIIATIEKLNPDVPIPWLESLMWPKGTMGLIHNHWIESDGLPMNSRGRMCRRKEIAPYEILNDPCIYVIQSGNGPFKIGKTNHVESRLPMLQSSAYEELRLICTLTAWIPQRTEKALHYYFKEKNVRGEWFDLSKQDLVSLESSAGDWFCGYETPYIHSDKNND